jgi:hypothetical protein
MILSKTLARDILTVLTLSIDKVRAEKTKENAHKVIIYYGVIQLLDTPLSELKITWLRHALGFLADWIIT